MTVSDPVELQPAVIDVISIQSLVAYGYVGNSVAWPAMQAAGLRVAMVPTVMLSNTPHYDSIHGGVIPDAWFDGILGDLNRRGVTRQARVILTGFLGSPEQAIILARWITAACREYPQLRVQIDPVIGDYAQGVFVDERLIEVYRQHLLPLADGLVPNLFELEKLTGSTVNSPEEIVTAARLLLAQTRREGAGWVLVTSTPPLSGLASEIGMALVTADTVEHISHRRIDSNPKGTGDLFSALLTQQLLQGKTLAEAARAASACVVHMLEQTRESGWQEMAFDFQSLGALRNAVPQTGHE